MKVRRLNESDIQRIVKRVLNEDEDWTSMVNIDELKFYVYSDNKNITKEVSVNGVIVSIDIKSGTFTSNDKVMIAIAGGLTFDGVLPKPEKVTSDNSMSTFTYNINELIKPEYVKENGFIEMGSSIKFSGVNIKPIEDDEDERHDIKEPTKMVILIGWRGSKYTD